MEGVLPLRYCATRFACFLLGVFRSGVMLLISFLVGVEDVCIFHVAPCADVDADADVRAGGAGGNWAGRRGGLRKRVRLNSKNSSASCVSRWFGFAVSSPCLQEVEAWWSSPWS